MYDIFGEKLKNMVQVYWSETPIHTNPKNNGVKEFPWEQLKK